jgi:hypothetical protein
MPPVKPQDVDPLDAVALVCETAMVVLLVFAGHGMVSGWRGWALGVFLGVVAIGIWVQWMSATSLRRLPNPTRYVVQVMLFLTVALYAAAGGLVWWGLGFAVFAIAFFGSMVRDDP